MHELLTYTFVYLKALADLAPVVLVWLVGEQPHKFVADYRQRTGCQGSRGEQRRHMHCHTGDECRRHAGSRTARGRFCMPAKGASCLSLIDFGQVSMLVNLA